MTSGACISAAGGQPPDPGGLFGKMSSGITRGPFCFVGLDVAGRL